MPRFPGEERSREYARVRPLRQTRKPWKLPKKATPNTIKVLGAANHVPLRSEIAQCVGA